MHTSLKYFGWSNIPSSYFTVSPHHSSWAAFLTKKRQFQSFGRPKLGFIKDNTGNFPETWRPWLICKSCTYICMNFILISSLNPWWYSGWMKHFTYMNKWRWFSSLTARGCVFLIPLTLTLLIHPLLVIPSL